MPRHTHAFVKDDEKARPMHLFDLIDFHNKGKHLPKYMQNEDEYTPHHYENSAFNRRFNLENVGILYGQPDKETGKQRRDRRKNKNVEPEVVSNSDDELPEQPGEGQQQLGEIMDLINDPAINRQPASRKDSTTTFISIHDDEQDKHELEAVIKAIDKEFTAKEHLPGGDGQVLLEEQANNQLVLAG